MSNTEYTRITVSGVRKWHHLCGSCRKKITSNDMMVEVVQQYKHRGECNFYHVECAPAWVSNYNTEDIEYIKEG